MPGSAAVKTFSGSFGSESCKAEDWCDWVFEAVVDAIKAGQPATVLAHPACMQLADGLGTFERLCTRVAERYKPVWVSEVTT